MRAVVDDPVHVEVEGVDLGDVRAEDGLVDERVALGEPAVELGDAWWLVLWWLVEWKEAKEEKREVRKKKKKKAATMDSLVRVSPSFSLEKTALPAPVCIALVAGRSPRGLGGVKKMLERGGKRALRCERRSSCMGAIEVALTTTTMIDFLGPREVAPPRFCSTSE